MYLKLIYFTGDMSMIPVASEADAEAQFTRIDAVSHEIQEAYIVELVNTEFRVIKKLC